MDLRAEKQSRHCSSRGSATSSSSCWWGSSCCRLGSSCWRGSSCWGGSSCWRGSSCCGGSSCWCTCGSTSSCWGSTNSSCCWFGAASHHSSSTFSCCLKDTRLHIIYYVYTLANANIIRVIPRWRLGFGGSRLANPTLPSYMPGLATTVTFFIAIRAIGVVMPVVPANVAGDMG